MSDITERLRSYRGPWLVPAEAADEIEKLRGEVARLIALTEEAVSLVKDVKAERDAAVGLLRELVNSRHKHYIHQTDEIMQRWDERVSTVIDATKGEK